VWCLPVCFYSSLWGLTFSFNFFLVHFLACLSELYRDADKSLARPTSRCILFDGENISFDASLFICKNSTNIPPVMITIRILLPFFPTYTKPDYFAPVCKFCLREYYHVGCVRLSSQGQH